MTTAFRSVCLAMACCLVSPAYAEVCDYRPTQLIGEGATGGLAVAGAGAALTGMGAKAAGFYTLTHAVTGATMLGSVAGGASAAGTVGIMGGTAGLMGTAAAVLMAPVTIAAGAVVGASVIAFEGACYFHDERITSYDEVLALMEAVAENADPMHFAVAHGEEGDARVLVGNSQGERRTYYVRNLYIVNGVLMHRDWFRNTIIGNLGFTFR